MEFVTQYEKWPPEGIIAANCDGNMQVVGQFWVTIKPDMQYNGLWEATSHPYIQEESIHPAWVNSDIRVIFFCFMFAFP